MDLNELDEIVSRLRSSSELDRSQAADDFQNHVLRTQGIESRRIYPSESRLWEYLKGPLRSLCVSENINDKWGGLLAIEKIITVFDESHDLISRLSGFVIKALPCQSGDVMDFAAGLYAKMAQSSGTRMFQNVGFQLKNKIEWLQDARIESRRHAATLLIAQLSKRVPEIIVDHVADICDNLWSTLNDDSVHVRESAAEALSQCLSIAATLNSETAQECFDLVYNQAQSSQSSTNVNTIHGSLLAYMKLLQHSGSYMKDKHDQVCQITLQHKDHKSISVRKVVIDQLPVLAEYDKERFSTFYLNTSIKYLLAKTRKPREQADAVLAFEAVGELAKILKEDISPYLEEYLESIRACLLTRHNKSAPCGDVLFRCISMLSFALGPKLHDHISELLEPMFSCGLDDTLTSTLAQVAENIPSLRRKIQERLLDLIAEILESSPVVHLPSSPLRSKFPSSPLRSRFPAVFSTTTILEESPSNDLHEHFHVVHNLKIKDALHTLSRYDFSNIDQRFLPQFTMDHVAKYISDNDARIREAAAIAMCKSFVIPSNEKKSSMRPKTARDIYQAIQLVLQVAVTEEDPSTRENVLSACKESDFYSFLPVTEHLSMLFPMLNDENVRVKKVALKLLEGLVPQNEGVILPMLRKMLINGLTDLTEVDPDDSTKREENTEMLGCMFLISPSLTEPYVKSILQALLPLSEDPNPFLASAAISSLGELSKVRSTHFKEPDVRKQYMNVLLKALSDQTSTHKRLAALRTLGTFVSTSGYVIRPYIDYPELHSMLIRILSNRPKPHIRSEVIKTMGLIGAIDSHELPSNAQRQVQRSNEPLHQSECDLSPAENLYAARTATAELIKLLRDTQQTDDNGGLVVEAIVSVLSSLRLVITYKSKELVANREKESQYSVSRMRTVFKELFAIVVKELIGAAHRFDGFQDNYFQELCRLADIAKEHMVNYLDILIDLINDVWANARPPTKRVIVELLEKISSFPLGVRNMKLSKVIPRVAQLLISDAEGAVHTSAVHVAVLQLFDSFGPHLGEHLNILISATMQTIQQPRFAVSTRQRAIQTLASLCRTFNFYPYSSMVVRPLLAILGNNDSTPVLAEEAMNTFCALLFELRDNFKVYIPAIKRQMEKHNVKHPGYTLLVEKLEKDDIQPSDYVYRPTAHQNTDYPIASLASDNEVNETISQLRAAWTVTEGMKTEDWEKWMKDFGLQLLRSSSRYFQPCISLAEDHSYLYLQLFPAAFASCWIELNKEEKIELAEELQKALASSTMSTELVHFLYDVIEFMFRNVQRVPIPFNSLSLCSIEHRVYSKGLYWAELGCKRSPSRESIERLLQINMGLDDSESATGILSYAQSCNIEFQEDWYIYLAKWDDGLAAYKGRLSVNADDEDAVIGRLRCLHALGDWEQFMQVSGDYWERSSPEIRKKIAPLGAASAWSLSQWDVMQSYVSFIEPSTFDRAWYDAVIAVHDERYSDADININNARDLLDASVLTMEKYPRAYGMVKQAQLLAELDEIIQYKQLENSSHSEDFRITWESRLRGCHNDMDVWSELLRLHSVALDPSENVKMWITFANMCRKNGQASRCQRVLDMLLEAKGEPDTYWSLPMVKYTYIKYKWVTGDKDKSLEEMRGFTEQLSTYIRDKYTGDRDMTTEEINDYIHLLSRCYEKVGRWNIELMDDWGSKSVSEVLKAFNHQAKLNPHSGQAWHSWAIALSEIVLYHSKDRDDDSTANELSRDISDAIACFCKSISISRGSGDDTIQDTLRMLTLWFSYGSNAAVAKSVRRAVSELNIEVWLDVIPQLIARIHDSKLPVRKQVQDLLGSIGRAHPQAIAFALTVVSEDEDASRSEAAKAILQMMRLHSARLVEHTTLVATELNKVANLPHELFYRKMEDAFHLYAVEGKYNEAVANLESANEDIFENNESRISTIILREWMPDLTKLRKFVNRGRETGNMQYIEQTWYNYRQIIMEIANQEKFFTSLRLSGESRKLFEARDLEIVIPGRYKVGEEVPTIKSFGPRMKVFPSRQHPRQLTIKGSDGNPYGYLLKGNEDLRQDERAMQLFGLVNGQLKRDQETSKRNLSILQYPVIPLSQNSGLLGWLGNTETMHTTIERYRKGEKRKMHAEQILIEEIAPQFSEKCRLHKVEPFEYVLSKTEGNDLADSQWMKSENSEDWIYRRKNFTRSLAVMSMVGHILGLGDRHPANILIRQDTGQIAHIDLSECYENAQYRLSYPEQVPFRLTRMLIYAMELSGIEGTFRITCEHTMRVLRGNKESITAILEAFVHDPLINWKTLKPIEAPKRLERAAENGTQKAERRHRRTVAKANNDDNAPGEPNLNERAKKIIDRVQQKLKGKEFHNGKTHDVKEQVDQLIEQATLVENLAQHFLGWCAFW